MHRVQDTFAGASLAGSVCGPFNSTAFRPFRIWIICSPGSERLTLRHTQIRSGLKLHTPPAAAVWKLHPAFPVWAVVPFAYSSELVFRLKSHSACLLTEITCARSLPWCSCAFTTGGAKFSGALIRKTCECWSWDTHPCSLQPKNLKCSLEIQGRSRGPLVLAEPLTCNPFIPIIYHVPK